MKVKKKVLWPVLILGVAGIAGFFWWRKSQNSKDDALPKVKVTKGNLVDKALAVGTIEPENEISIKSKVSGVVQKIFADVGVYVKVGEPLLEVRPDPTPLELAEAKRNLELAQVERNNIAKENARKESLLNNKLISSQEYESSQRQFEEAELRLNIAREKLALIESGKIKIGKTQIETVIKSPIDGYVLSKTVEVGDPVTPLTSFQEGTVLMRIADMKQLIFKGTVDEIDVGKLREGQEAEIKIGALPDHKIKGELRLISLKAEKKENATVFPIEIVIDQSNGTTLRAGYSANANIIIQKKDSVLVVPERVVTFRNDSAFVKLTVSKEKSKEQQIVTGLSDAISVEILSGLKEGDEVLEKPVKKIE